MPIMAPNRTPNSIQRRLLECVVAVSVFRLLATGAASSSNDCQGTTPVSTMATPIYKIVQTTSVAMMPIGRSRCGLRASSAAVETEEARNPQRDHPIGIIATLVVCTILYIGVAIVLTGVV